MHIPGWCVPRTRRGKGTKGESRHSHLRNIGCTEITAAVFIARSTPITIAALAVLLLALLASGIFPNLLDCLSCWRRLSSHVLDLSVILNNNDIGLVSLALFPLAQLCVVRAVVRKWHVFRLWQFWLDVTFAAVGREGLFLGGLNFSKNETLLRVDIGTFVPGITVCTAVRVAIRLLDTWGRVTSTVGGVLDNDVRVETSVLQASGKRSGKLQVVRIATGHLTAVWACRLRPRNGGLAACIVPISFGSLNNDISAGVIWKVSGDIRLLGWHFNIRFIMRLSAATCKCGSKNTPATRLVQLRPGLVGRLILGEIVLSFTSSFWRVSIESLGLILAPADRLGNGDWFTSGKDLSFGSDDDIFCVEALLLLLLSRRRSWCRLAARGRSRVDQIQDRALS
ncbi:hypothetical protein HG530_005085 [Fusarium avenaceum]|nr:hypothetical protein HG530_005085 [Fusarium avenaceum]